MIKKSMEKRGQITIFIIVALVIVSAIALYFLWIGPTFISPEGGRLDFDGCVQDSVERAVEDLGAKAGYVEPDLSYGYMGEDVGYLCYTNLYYKPCSVQKPFLKQHMEENIERVTREEVARCYENSLDELRARGFDVESEGMDYDVVLEPGKIIVAVEAPTTIARESGRRFVSFNSEMNSPLYEALMISTSILQFETKYGDSDVNSLMMYNPDLSIKKLKQGDGTTIYIVEDIQSQTKFQFASRSFAWPAGYGLGTGLVKE